MSGDEGPGQSRYNPSVLVGENLSRFSSDSIATARSAAYKVFEVTVDGVRAVCKFGAHPTGDTVGYNFVSDSATTGWRNCSRDYSRQYEAGIEGRVQRVVDHETWTETADSLGA